MRHLLVNQLNREEDFTVVGEAENGRDAISLIIRFRPDLILLDLDMPVMNGLETISDLKKLDITAPILLLTEHRNLTHLHCHNVPILSKECALNALLESLRHLIHGDSVQGQQIGSHSELRERIQRLAQRSQLTDREQLVFEKVIFTAATSREIATEITRDTPYAISETAVKHTLTRIMRKLNVEPRTRAALTKLLFQ